MGTMSPGRGDGRQLGTQRAGNSGFLSMVQTLSRIVTTLFLVALVWAIYAAVVSGNPLPVWAWFGMVALLAAAIGLGVAVVVYRGVRREVGPFDFGPSQRVTGELKREIRHVQAGGAHALQAEIRMTQGILQVRGGAAAAMEATFTYDDADWRSPQVDYAVSGSGEGQLLVKQLATQRPAMHQGRSEWEIGLSQTIPTQLNVKVGAGKAELQLGGMTLTGLRVESGVGELLVDLGGAWQQSMEAFVKSGIGDAVLRLPRDIGVRVHTTVGLGSLSTADLRWDGEAYVNVLYGQSAVNLEIVIEGGMGKVALEVG